MVILGFNGNLNVSISIGDSVYYIETQTVGTNTDNSTAFTFGSIPEPTIANQVVIGVVDSILTNDTNSIFYTNETLQVTLENSDGEEVITTVNTIINVQESGPLITPPNNSFLFFSKDNRYNMSSLTGYYGEVQFRNNSTISAELYATACEVVQSSK
jgi:hypothetical protein|tara:strand:- start:1905 stop:2375 length:471 start_codon:yes stop_codon:yes gene_type:complete